MDDISEEITIQRVKKLAEASGLTLSQVAVNINNPSINHLANETTNPKAKILKDLSQYFNVSINYLLGLEEERNVPCAEPVRADELQKVPIIYLSDVKIWFDNPDQFFDRAETEYLYYDLKLNPQAFAVKIENGSYRPRYIKDTVLIVNPQEKYDADDVVVCAINRGFPALREIVEDSGEMYFKSFAIIMPADKVEFPQHVIYGKIIETIIIN